MSRGKEVGELGWGWGGEYEKHGKL